MPNDPLFNLDPLAVTVILLVGFLGLIVIRFASRYLAGDSHYGRFFCYLGLLVISVMVMAAADHLLVFLVAWGAANILLIRLMIHKPQWQAAANSGRLAAKTLAKGFVCLATAFVLLFLSTGQASIQRILAAINDVPTITVVSASLLMMAAAMSQSGIWPFHRWLISSANAPTPVSAIMHAGLVNGGGILLTRFAQLFFAKPILLTLIFVIGLVTAVIGSVWKLMQNDIKRMLACSTMAQMGFMLMQCGLGLFAAALAHLCWHGLFKANLFLHANTVKQDGRINHGRWPTFVEFTIAMIVAAIGSYVFSLSSHQAWIANNTTLFLMVIVFLTAYQLSLKILEQLTWKKVVMSIALTTICCGIYGMSIHLIKEPIASLHLMRPQDLNVFHYAGLIILCLMWAAMVFQGMLLRNQRFKNAASILYVKALNASQPHPSTITAYRHQYRY